MSNTVSALDPASVTHCTSGLFGALAVIRVAVVTCGDHPDTLYHLGGLGPRHTRSAFRAGSGRINRSTAVTSYLSIMTALGRCTVAFPLHLRIVRQDAVN